MPRFLASLTASRERSLALSEIAGVIPVMWNQSTPSKALSQSISPGCARQMEDQSRFAGTLVSAGFEIVNTDAAFVGADDAAHIHTEPAELANTFIRDRVFREHRQKSGVLPIVGKRNGNIGFTAAESGFKCRTLEETFQTGGLQTEHDFAKG